jgi:hypothetical protein
MVQQQPYRPSERAGEMANRAVGHDDEIEASERRRRIGEIVDQRIEIDDRRVGERRELGRRRSLLQAGRAARREG